MYIPVEAVFYDGDVAVCFVWNDGSPLRRPVELGESDGTHVVVNVGLDTEDEVLLVYPDEFET